MNGNYSFEESSLYTYLGKYFSYILFAVTSYFDSFSFLFLPIFITIVFLFITYLFCRILITKQFLKKQKVFLKLTPPALTEKTAYTTQQLFSVLHTIGSQRTIWERLLGKKVLFSFEIVSTREQGIRYMVQTTIDEADIVKKTIRSYMPYVHIEEGRDYLPEKFSSAKTKIIEFKLKNHFALPLAKQDVLSEHDPVAYITGMMTKLEKGEMIALQVVLSPTTHREVDIISQKVLRNEDVLQHLVSFRIPWIFTPFIIISRILSSSIYFLVGGIGSTVTEVIHGSSRQGSGMYQSENYQQLQVAQKIRPARVLSMFEQEVVASVQEKIQQVLFETTIRAVLIIDQRELNQRIRGIKSSLSPFTVPKYQSLIAKHSFPPFILQKIRLFTYRHRILSLFQNKNHSLLSASEIGDLYHFPFTQTTKTENISKAMSRELPAPLSLKKGRKLDVIFGENTYGGTVTHIGLTNEERATHMYLIGRTGSGKTTLMFSMAQHDIEEGRGMAFLDPHGDISEELLAIIPKERINDLIYFNPMDLKYPIGINLLELTPGLDEDEAELEKEVVAEGVISLFRKVFSQDENTNAHRIEYILRNTIYTAFTTENPTLFTIYDLLNNPPFQKQIISKLQDENLKNFWKFEFGRAGNFQVVKMVGGVTAKVGRFLFSPTAKRILEQKHSTINFDEILQDGKILICNVSQGNLGDDTARLLGTTILTKIQQAALRRARIARAERKPFYLYVDEFQNFATTSFIKLLSEGRKYGLSVTIAEQSTSQQADRNIVQNILANVTTVVCFRSANPIDEQLMLTQFAPFVEPGDISNLPRYQFYIKISALEPEETFSGKTLYTPLIKDEKYMQNLIKSSRDTYAIVYKREKIMQKSTMQSKKIRSQFQKHENNQEEIAEILSLPEL